VDHVVRAIAGAGRRDGLALDERFVEHRTVPVADLDRDGRRRQQRGDLRGRYVCGLEHRRADLCA
jgi:hypothetical protein